MAESTFTWLHFDAEHARRANDLVRALSEPSTLDSLGIGPIRDGFADVLFPGTSTLHTRAVYLMYIPWSVQHVASRKPKSAKQYDKWLRDAEIATIEALKSGSTDQAPSGIIGRTAGTRLRRMPSEMYWSALAAWRIRDDFGGQPLTRAQVGELVIHDPEAARQLWKGLPRKPADFLDGPLPILPTFDQATFLLERFSRTVTPSRSGRHRSLFSYMAHHPALSTSNSLWDLDLPDDDALRRTVYFAKGFASTIQGARLRYLSLLFEDRAELDPETDIPNRDRLDSLIEKWQADMTHNHDELTRWVHDLDAMFDSLADNGARVPPSTRQFVKNWSALAVRNPEAAMFEAAPGATIRAREQSLKGASARLSNRSPLISWHGELIGATPIDYRWGVAQRLIRDCIDGLESAYVGS